MDAGGLEGHARGSQVGAAAGSFVKGQAGGRRPAATALFISAATNLLSSRRVEQTTQTLKSRRRFVSIARLEGFP